MTAGTGPSGACREQTPLVKRTLTREGSSGLELVGWSRCSVRITERDGRVAFSADDIEAPLSWSSLAVAVVARRYFATEPGGRREHSVRGLVDRVVGAIASWALEGGQVGGAGERDALRDELAALVVTQRATFATPVWLNAGVGETSADLGGLHPEGRGLDPRAARLEHPRGADLPAGGRRRDQPLAGPLLPRARCRAAAWPAGRCRLCARLMRGLRRSGRGAGRGAARRWSCSTPRIPTSSSSSRPRHARRIEVGRCSPPGTRSRRWSARSPSSTPTTRCG